jgi:AraC family transcriptional regulator of adaptative response/methylated-DNA-[protein]-cysteine methyltransferase
MTEINALDEDSDAIAYGFGQSSLGDFLAAIDDKGLCAVLIGDRRSDLLRDLQTAFPNRRLAPCDCHPCFDFLVNAVAGLIERPAASVAFPTSIQGGDFEQMVHAALRRTEPGTTITPEALATMIGASVESASNVRACAAADRLAVAEPFHRLQEQDGTSPSYRWGEERRRALLRREAAGWPG